MKHDEHVDELFRNGFNPDFSDEIPDDFLADINQRLDQFEQSKRKKRTPVFWWVAGIFSLVGVILFTYSFTQPQRNQTTEISDNKSKQSLKSRSSKNQLSENQGLALNQNPSTSIVNKSQNKTFQEIYLLQTNSKTNGKQILDVTTNSDLNIPENHHSTKNLAIQTAFQNEISQTEDTDILNEIVSNSDSIITKEQIPVTSSLTTQISLQNSQVDSSQNSRFIDSSHLIPPNNNIIVSVNDSTQKTNKKIQFSLSFYSGVSGVFHKVLMPNPSFGTFETTSSLTPVDYRNKRKIEENSITSLDMALRFGMQFRKLTFSTGIDYFVWGERTDYSNVSYNAQHQNTYRYVNIPVLLGYQIQKGSFGIQPSLGLSIGLLAKQTSGFYLNLDNSALSYQAEINKLTSTVHLGVELAYFSQSGVKVSLSPAFRKSIIPIVQSELVKNSYSSLGLQLGIGYRW
jgi:hypothetical protein